MVGNILSYIYLSLCHMSIIWLMWITKDALTLCQYMRSTLSALLLYDVQAELLSRITTLLCILCSFFFLLCSSFLSRLLSFLFCLLSFLFRLLSLISRSVSSLAPRVIVNVFHVYVLLSASLLSVWLMSSWALLYVMCTDLIWLIKNSVFIKVASFL